MQDDLGNRLQDEGRRIVEGLGGRWTVRGAMCRCPAHQDRTPSLSVRPGRARLLLRCFAGCDVRDVLAALRSRRLLSANSVAAEVMPGSASFHASLQSSALRIWHSAQPLARSRAEAHLKRRGIGLRSPELRFHPRTPHGPLPITRFRPAMIAAVRDANGLTGIHRTFLDGASERPRSSSMARSGLGRFGEGAVRLAEAGPVLGLAEGIETALSATQLFGIPCWATLGAGRFGRVTLPADVEEVVLFLDNDAGGGAAGHAARAALSGKVRIAVRYPEIAGADWNDVLQAGLHA